jgi:hypothetical protein
MNGKSKDIVHAEVILQQPKAAKKSTKNQKSLEAADKVAGKLRAMGFEVSAVSPLTISISGPAKLFEQELGAGEGMQSSELKVPKELAGQVEGIYVQRPPTYF